MASKESVNLNCGGCGCVSFIVLVFVLWALFVGLATPWGVFNIDLIPPAIRRTSE